MEGSMGEGWRSYNDLFVHSEILDAYMRPRS